jgi:hypothetical protein
MKNLTIIFLKPNQLISFASESENFLYICFEISTYELNKQFDKYIRFFDLEKETTKFTFRTKNVYETLCKNDMYDFRLSKTQNLNIVDLGLEYLVSAHSERLATFSVLDSLFSELLSHTKESNITVLPTKPFKFYIDILKIKYNLKVQIKGQLSHYPIGITLRILKNLYIAILGTCKFLLKNIKSSSIKKVGVKIKQCITGKEIIIILDHKYNDSLLSITSSLDHEVVVVYAQQYDLRNRPSFTNGIKPQEFSYQDFMTPLVLLSSFIIFLRLMRDVTFHGYSGMVRANQVLNFCILDRDFLINLASLIQKALLTVRIVEQLKPSKVILPHLIEPEVRVIKTLAREKKFSVILSKRGSAYHSSELAFCECDEIRVPGRYAMETLLEYGIPSSRVKVASSIYFQSNIKNGYQALTRYHRSRKKIVYFSEAEYPVWYNEQHALLELEYLVAIFKELSGLTLEVRFHPTESPRLREKKLDIIRSSKTASVFQSDPTLDLEEVLSNCDVALMKQSTVGFNALASGVPVVIVDFFKLFNKRNCFHLNCPGVIQIQDTSSLRDLLMSDVVLRKIDTEIFEYINMHFEGALQ